MLQAPGEPILLRFAASCCTQREQSRKYVRLTPVPVRTALRTVSIGFSRVLTFFVRYVFLRSRYGQAVHATTSCPAGTGVDALIALWHALVLRPPSA